MSTWVYIKSEPRLWTVGFYKPDRIFEPESDHSSSDDAAKRAHYLNGGEDADTRQLRDLLAEVLADLKAGDVGRLVAGAMPSGWGADEYQVHLWCERAEKAGVRLR